MIGPALVVALTNAQSDLRPSGARAALAHDALADVGSATELLEPFLDLPIDEFELAMVRAVQRAVVTIVDRLVDHREPQLQALNALAAREAVVYALEQGSDGSLRASVRPKRASAAATLLLAVIGELSRLEPSRLRRCARPECGLVFYDSSRSGTQRWHAERPCGLRERQRRYRGAHAA